MDKSQGVCEKRYKYARSHHCPVSIRLYLLNPYLGPGRSGLGFTFHSVVLPSQSHSM
ncbi:hypothetical protein HMPREF9374_1618 [Desmospora sp. 8437]|nr:hypothetical protein HMPREF9374_1618 [Desmospora sp. 8437]